jgi:hypothetical protein
VNFVCLALALLGLLLEALRRRAARGTRAIVWQ